MWGQLLAWVLTPPSQLGRLHPDTTTEGKANSSSGAPPWAGCRKLHLNSWWGLLFWPLCPLPFPPAASSLLWKQPLRRKQGPQRVFRRPQSLFPDTPARRTGAQPQPGVGTEDTEGSRWVFGDARNIFPWKSEDSPLPSFCSSSSLPSLNEAPAQP